MSQPEEAIGGAPDPSETFMTPEDQFWQTMAEMTIIDYPAMPSDQTKVDCVAWWLNNSLDIEEPF